MAKTTKETNSKKEKKLNSKKTSVSKKKSSTNTVSKKSTSAVKSQSKKASSGTKKAKTNVSTTVKSNKKAPSKKQTKSVSKSKQQNSKKALNILEYYDLPYRYNQTIVKILAQTPKTLFVYWDISDDDRKNYIKKYGNEFFENTKPVLIVHNLTMNYTFEIEINDFANCWYFNVNDEKCEYSVELGRRARNYINYTEIPNNYLYITSSNKIESPNGHILFEKSQNIVFFKNVKNNQTFSKDITHFGFMRYLGKIYNIYDMYKKIYKEDEILNIDNPTSYGRIILLY